MSRRQANLENKMELNRYMNEILPFFSISISTLFCQTIFSFILFSFQEMYFMVINFSSSCYHSFFPSIYLSLFLSVVLYMSITAHIEMCSFVKNCMKDVHFQPSSRLYSSSIYWITLFMIHA